jgi:heme A synthase
LPRLAWGALFFNLAVIVWGAFVRASGSGAGCGSHWPLCNGQIIPHTGLITTAIEFAHRLTSGGCLILAGLIGYFGYRDYPKASAVRRASLGVVGFTLSEALIGAGLVLLRYVDHDQSLGRAVSICLHLCNTFALLAALALCAWWSTYAPAFRLERRPGSLWNLGLASLLATTLLAVTGAMTALGDTLFHSTSLTGGLSQDFASGSHFLVRLRILHPILAVATGLVVFYFAEQASDRPGSSSRLTSWLKGLVVSQLILGGVNLVLLAPIGLQLLHLAVAESLWVALVLTGATTFEQRETLEQRAPARPEATEATPALAAPMAPIEALEAFSARLPRGGRVLVCAPGSASWFGERGFEVETLPHQKDLRLFSTKAESIDGIWAEERLADYSIEDAQRIVAAFFRALRPNQGVFFASHRYPPDAFASLLRQNGFKTCLNGQNDAPTPWSAVVSQRI